MRFAPDWLAWLPFVWANYWVIDLADDYSYAVVGEPGREYLWILARAPQMSDGVYARIVGQASRIGIRPGATGSQSVAPAVARPRRRNALEFASRSHSKRRRA